jgi:hypothetical protein
MSNVESIEQQIEKLSPAELTAFRSWYAAFDVEAWDRQFEADASSLLNSMLPSKVVDTLAGIR